MGPKVHRIGADRHWAGWLGTTIVSRGMLIHDFAHVEVPATVVRARLCGEPGMWLTALAREEGEGLRMRVAPLDAVPFLSKSIIVELGKPAERGVVTIVPMTWRPEGMERAFPALEAELEISAIASDLTELNLMGHYDPPLGLIGRHLDQAFVHRLARAGVRSFMRRLATALSEATPPQVAMEVPERQPKPLPEPGVA